MAFSVTRTMCDLVVRPQCFTLYYSCSYSISSLAVCVFPLQGFRKFVLLYCKQYESILDHTSKKEYIVYIWITGWMILNCKSCIWIHLIWVLVLGLITHLSACTCIMSVLYILSQLREVLYNWFLSRNYY